MRVRTICNPTSNGADYVQKNAATGAYRIKGVTSRIEYGNIPILLIMGYHYGFCHRATSTYTSLEKASFMVSIADIQDPGKLHIRFKEEYSTFNCY